ncbi:hypothetical protein [Bacillus marinisedimentorum]|uniref:hypothetical protein n=1 Tax=Bacillus marinisedimentorum TaxID=1821260 RepID=UPI000871E284|nr:hypothetical protein [Bacillus marinisedimentorum]
MKETYFIALRTGDIQKLPFDEDQQYFELYATPQEVNALRDQLNEAGAKGDTHEYFLHPDALMHPLAEDAGDEDRNEYGNTVREIYHKIYLLGTIETQKKIESMGILGDSQLDH